MQVKHMTKDKEITKFRWFQVSAVLLQWFFWGYGGEQTTSWKSSGFQVAFLEIFFPVGAYVGNMRREGKTISSNLSGDSAANVCYLH